MDSHNQVSSPIEQLESGLLRAEGQRAHGIHDEVDPQHHHRIEGRALAAVGGGIGGEVGHSVGRGDNQLNGGSNDK